MTSKSLFLKDSVNKISKQPQTELKGKLPFSFVKNVKISGEIRLDHSRA